MKEINENNSQVKWLIGSETDKEYKTSTWFRCLGIEEFVKKVEEENKIVGIVFEGNNIGFIIDNNTTNPTGTAVENK